MKASGKESCARWTWAIVLLAAFVAGCASLPSQEGRPESRALADTRETRLGRAAAPLAAVNPGLSGIHALPIAADAFAARMLLAAAAQRSIDAQYYIWHGDQTGRLLFDALANAANRGVRVRMLVDDQNTRPIEADLAALAARPNIEVRLYNPFAQRNARFLDYLGDFARVNRRMHNKSFVADNQVAIVGGRNIGNEYFGAGTEVPFQDLDVVAIGEVVQEVSGEFDRYWNSASAYPVPRVLQPPGPDAQAALDERLAAARDDPESREYLEAVRRTPLVEALVARRLAIEWAAAHVVSDDPAKTLDTTERRDVLLLSSLLAGGRKPRRSLDIISPYFVPAEAGTAALTTLARSGVRVRVLTNSFAATDVSVVHSGYAKRRCELARAGVQLFELKPSAAELAAGHREKKDGKTTQSASVSLHAKTFAVDGEQVFVGSFNFDPRSALLNTEMGVVIASPVLAVRLSDTFETLVPRAAYEVRAREGDGCIEWVERTPQGEVRHASEPETGWGRRAWLGLLTLLPIDWLL